MYKMFSPAGFEDGAAWVTRTGEWPLGAEGPPPPGDSQQGNEI